MHDRLALSRWVGGIILLMAVSRTAAAQNISRLGIWPIVPQQDGISCGPICCTMVLSYYGQPTAVETLKTDAGTRWGQFGKREIGLTFPQGIVRALKQHGVASSIKTKLGLANLAQWIDEDRPPILPVRSGQTTWHYLVAVGYTARLQKIRIADPGAERLYLVDADKLEIGWSFSGDYLGRIFEPLACAQCNGTGQYHRVPCITCGGRGREVDIYRAAVELFVSPHAAIVPDAPPLVTVSR